MLDNHPAFVLAWFALARLGAIEVPVNTAFVGASLRHVLTDSRAELFGLRAFCPGSASRCAPAWRRR